MSATVATARQAVRDLERTISLAKEVAETAAVSAQSAKIAAEWAQSRVPFLEGNLRLAKLALRGALALQATQPTPEPDKRAGGAVPGLGGA